MARRKSHNEDDSQTEGYSSDAPVDETDEERQAREEAEGREGDQPVPPKVGEKEDLTDTEIQAYQPCATPPPNPPTSIEVAQGVSAEKMKKERASQQGGEGENEEEKESKVEIQEDGMYRVGQDTNVKGRAFTKGESIFLEDDEVETLQNAGVKLMPPDRDPHEMGPKARKMAGLDEKPKGENPQY